MTTIAIDPKRPADAFEQAAERVNGGEAEVVLDLSAVPRIDSQTAGAVERLAGVTADRSAKVTLRGANGEVYKVLKLLKLTERFAFAG